MAVSGTISRSLLTSLTAALLASAAPGVAGAQANGWTVRRDPFAELWYHGLALASARDFGPLPLYSGTYVREVSEERRRRGLSTRLDALAPRLRNALASESELEVLHFVPLYFVGEPPELALAALHAAIRGARAPVGISSSLAARANAVAASLTFPASRATTLAFLEALQEEWRAFVRADRIRRAPDASNLAALQTNWTRSLEPALAGFLADQDRRRGILLVVPALGLEGRTARAAGGLTIVAVGADAPGMTADAPLLAAVRELAFALLDRVPQAPEASARNRLAAERSREIAAVRAGAYLIEEVAPRYTNTYRALFTSATAGGSALALESAFPMTAAAEQALRSVVSRYSTAHAPTP